MEQQFNSFIETLKKFDGIEIISTNLDPPWIHFRSEHEYVLSIITNQVAELKEQHGCAMLTLNNPDKTEDVSYQLLFEGGNLNSALLVFNKNLISILESNSKQSKAKELGIPDLSLVTLRQMAIELKNRSNLTFALVWIENNDRDNIAIEGSGHPTQLVGLLTRGTHMAIEWADKNIKFHRPDENDN